MGSFLASICLATKEYLSTQALLRNTLGRVYTSSFKGERLLFDALWAFLCTLHNIYYHIILCNFKLVLINASSEIIAALAATARGSTVSQIVTTQLNFCSNKYYGPYILAKGANRNAFTHDNFRYDPKVTNTC